MKLLVMDAEETQSTWGANLLRGVGMEPVIDK